MAAAGVRGAGGHGPLSAAAPRRGLPAGLPVVAGGGDNAAAAVGCGVVRPGTGFVSLGTSGVVFVPSAGLGSTRAARCTRSATPCRAPTI